MLAFFLSLFPILIILFMLFVLKQSAWKAGLVGCMSAMVLAANATVFEVSLSQLYHPIAKGALTSTIVAYVLVFGILLFHLMNESGVIKNIASFISNSTHDPLRQVIILTFAFSPLVESSSGFGIAMIVVAPILIALGFDRFKAVLISLISLHAVPWGTLAMGTVIGANLGNLSVQQLGTGSALLSIPTFLYFAFLIIFIAGGWSGVKEKFLETLIVSGTFGLSVLVINIYISVELAGVFGSLAALLVELLFIRFASKKAVVSSLLAKSEISIAVPETSIGAVKTFSPYLLLIGLLLMTRLIPSVGSFVQSFAVISLPDFNFSLPLLYSPGFYLLVTCIGTVVLFKMNLATMVKAIRLTWTQAFPVIFSTLFFVVMSEIMSSAGMYQTIAQAAAALGAGFVILSPIIGGLGGFLAGSNTGSNAMFIKLQVQTAQNLGIPPELFAYAQNTSSSHLIMTSPSRVLLGASVSGITERENELLKRMAFSGLGTIAILIIGVVCMYFLQV